MKERHPTEILIEKARKLLSPSPVRLGHVPRWFASACRAALKKYKIYTGRYADSTMLMFRVAEAASVLANGKQASATWIDHWGSTTENGKHMFVTEPYLSIKDVLSAVEMANILGLEIDISSNSWWFPGDTTRIAFLAPANSPDLRPK